MYCPNCGKEVNSGKFCTGCGAKLDRPLSGTSAAAGSNIPVFPRQPFQQQYQQFNSQQPFQQQYQQFNSQQPFQQPYGGAQYAQPSPVERGSASGGNGGNNNDNTPEAPLSPEEKKRSLRRNGIAAGVVAIILVVAIAVTAVFNKQLSKPLELYSGGGENNSMVLADKVNLIENSKQIEKSFESVQYSEADGIYTLNYKTLPEEFASLKEGSFFVIPSNRDSKSSYFRMGFSGKVKKVEGNSISFEIPILKDIFKELKLDTRGVTPDTVAFIPESGVEVENFSVNTAAMGISPAKTDKLTLGDYTGEIKYYETDKESQLKDYNIIAKKLSLRISKKAELDSEGSAALEYSGNVTFDYPAIKFYLDYDGQKDEIKAYDVGFISDESISLKIKGTDELGLDDIQGAFSMPHIIDLKDASAFEKGKVTVGVLSVGYFIDTPGNFITGASSMGFGLTFDVGITANGKIEIECEANESGFLRVETNSKGKSICELKHKDYPNPVLGEELLDGDEEQYKYCSVDYSVHGEMEFKAGVSLDFCVSILGAVPCKLTAGILEYNTITSFDTENSAGGKTELVKETKFSDMFNVSFYQLKSEARIIFNIGANIKGKIAGEKIETEGFSFGGAYSLWNKVWLQYPKAVEFTKKECDFGNVQLGGKYTKEEIEDIFYERLEQAGETSLTGKAKDFFIQKTVDVLEDKLKVGIEAIGDFVNIDGDYELVCFSDGAFYFVQDGRVIAELIVGDGVYNRSLYSKDGGETLLRKIYSEPKHKTETKISFDSLVEAILKLIGLDELAKFNGQELSYYQYSSGDAHMEVCFDGNGNTLFIVAYEQK